MDPLLQEVIDRLADFGSNPDGSKLAGLNTAAQTYLDMTGYTLPAELQAQVEFANTVDYPGKLAAAQAVKDFPNKGGVKVQTAGANPWVWGGVALIAGLLILSRRR
jgi:hypothetical protein